MRRATRICCLALVLAAAAGVQAQVTRPALTDDDRRWLAEHPRITLGPYGNYAPVQFVDADGVQRGLAAEYVDRIEQMLSIEFVNVPTHTWQEILDKARAREIDVIALAAETRPRTEYLSFTRPYLDLEAVIIARDSVEKRLTPRDLEGFRVAVVEGYAVHDYLLERYPQLNLDPVRDTTTGLRKVSLGVDDAFISDLAVATYAIDREGITNLRIVGESGFVYHMGFAVRNDWPQLTAILDKALAQITPEQRAAIHARWISLSHETEFASRSALKLLLAAVAGIAVLAIGFLIWSRSLQRQVRARTERLKAELAERRRAAEALRESEQRIKLIIRSALDAVITMDADGMVTGWTEQAHQMLGFSSEEVMNHPLADLIIPPQHRQAHRDGLKRYLETGEGPVLNTRIEITALHRDGHEVPVELAIAPIRRGGQVEFSAFVRDITQRKQAEAELQQHRDRLEELVVERTAKMKVAMEAAEAAEAKLAVRVHELSEALSEVEQLRKLLPICSYCKRIREGEAYTQSVEAYLAEHHDTQFSHGICPECYEKHVRPQLERL